MLSLLEKIFEFDKYKYESDVIFIEEGQFFPDIVDFCIKAVDIDKKIVVVSALDGDFQRIPFTQISLLYSLADKITKLNAICLRCSNIGIQNDASFSLRTVSSMDKHFVGGKDSYEAVCRFHYLEGIKYIN
jgi:thymidine kinase